MYFQPKEQEAIKTRVTIELLVSMMFDPGYNILRTQEQLGYKVGFYTSPHAGITGVVVVI